MRPNDISGNLPVDERPFRVLLIAESDRRQYNCPGVDSKARTLIFRMAERLPQEWEIDLEDLGNVYARARIQSCNACVSTSMEGRTAAFFCYGDGGGDAIGEDGRPLILRHKEYFDPKAEPFENMRDAYGPLVWHCRYGGIEVPDDLWTYLEFGLGKKYSDNQAEDMIGEENVMQAFDSWTDRFAYFVAGKGKVTPGRYRAFGYEAPGHLGQDLQLAWREARMRLGVPPAGSSPEEQQRLGLNKDTTLRPGKSEGEKLRD